MPTKLYEVMRIIYSAYPLMLNLGNVRPGMLLHTRWGPGFPWDSRPKFTRQEGSAWKLLHLSDLTPYEDQLMDGNIIAGEITEKIGFGVNFPLPQYGLKVGASFSREGFAKLTVGAIRGRCFKYGYAGHELRLLLRKMKGTDPVRWPWVDNDFLVTESYYTENLRFEFEENGDFKAEAEFENAKVTFEGDFEVAWKKGMTLTLTGTADVPFAVRGLKV